MKFPGPESVARTLRMKTKYCLSFLTKNWTLRHYPLRVRRQADAPADPDSRFKLYPWSAQIDGWGVIIGSGNTREEALAQLAANFENEKARRASEGKPLPRPGTDVPIQFAPTRRIAAHGPLVDDFIRRVLALPWAFLSDESRLWDFHQNDSNDAYLDRIRSVYSVDCSDLADAPLIDILDRIASHQHAQRQ
jgi:hypothetical protein